ncbi:hypothetical protein R2O95_14330, partial [Faecalibacterium duncaniae]|nr:hypothetical protein [Faecalibacterium duncaniae]
MDLMRAARQVFCLGQGGSMLLANDICARFSSLSNKFRTIMSTTTNFWELLQQRQDELTKSGRAVADYLVHHADEAQYLS